VPCRLGIDVGATNTDFLLFDRATGATHVHKTRSTPENPTIGIERGIQELLRSASIRSTDIEELVHSVSLPAQVIAQRTGARVGLIVTAGFEQVLHLARGRTDANLTGWAGLQNPRPLADLAMTVGIAERMSARGDAIEPLEETAARAQIQTLLDRGAQAITIVLMHAYVNADHERRLKSMVRELDNAIPVTLSSELAPQAGEYERTLAAVANAYCQPAMANYFKDLQARLSATQLAPSIGIAHSTGGAMSAQHATDKPVYTLRSSVGSGARAAALVTQAAGFPNALAINIGGNSADVALIRNGAPRTSNQTTFDTGTAIDPLNLASMDVRSSGAGAGMIAHSPMNGMIRVGPHGAGAIGPACYGNGAVEPTVTDANLVLGRLPGSTHSLDVGAANKAVDGLADELGVDRLRAAEGIVNIANEQMAGVLRATAIEKDQDPGALALVVSGGAGPLHGGALGVLLQCAVVLVPRGREISQTSSDDLLTLAGQLKDKVLHELGSDAAQARVKFIMDVRYLRQRFQSSVAVSEAQLAGGYSALVKTSLADAYKRRYGISCDDSVELLTLRAIARVPGQSALKSFEADGGDLKRAMTEQAQVFFNGAFINTPVYDRSRLSVGAQTC